MAKKKELGDEIYEEEKTHATKSVLYNLWKNFSGGKKKNDQSEIEEKETTEEPEMEEVAVEEETPQRRERARERFPKKSPLLELYQTWRSEHQQNESREFGPQDLLLDENEELTEDHRALIKDAEDNAQEILWAFHGDGENGLQPAEGRICMRVSVDRLEAFLILLPPLYGGEEITQEKVQEKITQQNIKVGLDQAAIHQLAAGPSLYFKIVRVAAGIPPVHGEDGTIEEVVSRATGFRFVEKENGIVDFRDMNWFQQVKEGEILCKILPPSEPQNGVDIYGNSVAGKPGKKAAVPSGKNTIINEEGTALVAKVDGQVLIQGDKYHVEQTMTINGNVDFSIGNLDVTGNIVVHGDVFSGFEVKATGDITVNGMIEGATVIAGGNIFVRAGMNGNAKGKLIAGKDIKCKFLENSIAEARGDIYLESSINSVVRSWGAVLVKSGKGVLIGGEITAMKTIEATAVGSKLNLATHVALVAPESFLEEKAHLEKERQKLLGAINEQEQLNQSQAIARLKERDIQSKLEMMKELEEGVLKSVMRFNMVYPNTSVTIVKAHHTLREMRNQCMIYQKQGEIVFGAK
ncbi:MAG: DUF342 domain-containing protein [Clostridiales bacterium]|nr:DUF342 domain-containing protein [Clostridiales bacterium]